MNRAGLIAAICCALCATAYFSGRAFERAHRAAPAAIALPAPASVPTSPEPPADFGEHFYADVGSLSFADVYEIISSADARAREVWLHQIEGTPEGPRKIAALCEFFRALVQIDPKVAGDLVVKLKRHRSPAMEAIIFGAPPSAMSQLSDMLLRLPDEVRYFNSIDNLEMVVGEWAMIDPKAAADFVDQHNDLPVDQYGYALLGSWGEMDPEGALKWMQKHSDQDLAGAAIDWLRGWFTADAQRATDYALMHADDPLLAMAVPRIASGVFDRDQTAAKQFIQRLPNSKMRQDALEDIVTLASPDLAGDASAAGVANFILQFPDTEWPSGFSTALEEWRKIAASELYDWIERLPPDVQAKVIENFPGPEWRDEDSSFLPVLQLRDLDLRHRLLQRMIAVLNRYTSPQEVISKMHISEDYRTELSALLREVPPPSPTPQDSEEAQ